MLSEAFEILGVTQSQTKYDRKLELLQRTFNYPF